MTDKLIQDVQVIVDNIFKQKEELAMRKETEDALTKSADKITELTASLEAKDEEVSSLIAKVDELEVTATELSNKNKEFQESIEKDKSDFEAKEQELTERAEKAELELEDIKKDQLAKDRFDELKTEGVSASIENAVKDQIAKIREMDDDAFKVYKEERIELRKSIVAELEASTQNNSQAGDDTNASEQTTDASNTNVGDDATGGEANTTADQEEEAVASSVESIDMMQATAAMLNL